jgi:hypothetical protein
MRINMIIVWMGILVVLANPYTAEAQNSRIGDIVRKVSQEEVAEILTELGQFTTRNLLSSHEPDFGIGRVDL